LKKPLARLARQSPSMIVAMLALFVAMGGTAIAASSALITGKQIKNSSITGADVKNKSLTPKDFRGSVRGARGPIGPTGPQGAVGPPGAPNPNAVNSDKLDELDSTDFLRSNAKAADSEKVDGYEANGIARLEGTTFGGIPGTTSLPPFTAPSAGRAVLEAMCWGSAGATAIQVQFGLGTGGSTSSQETLIHSASRATTRSGAAETAPTAVSLCCSCRSNSTAQASGSAVATIGWTKLRPRAVRREV
jgi:hypothetical protein